MILTRLELQDFGVYAGRHVIELEPPSAEKPIILFGGLNGAGKTTLLEAVQLALYGTRTPTVKREGLGYEDYLLRCIHSSVAAHEGAAVHLTFKLRADGKDRLVQIRRNWYKKSNNVREAEEVFVGESSEALAYDAYLSEHWAEYIDTVVPLGVAPLFFFDADRIEGFADLANSGDLIRTAVHGLLGLDLVDRLALDLRVLERRKAGKEARTDHRDALANAEAAQAAVKAEHAVANDRVEQLGDALTAAEVEVALLDRRFREDGGDLFVERAKLEADRERVRAAIHQSEEELRRLASGSAPLLLVRDLLEDVRAEDERDQMREGAAVLQRVLRERDEALLGLIGDQMSAEPKLREIEAFLEDDRRARLEASGGPVVYGLSAQARLDLERLLEDGLDELADRIQGAVQLRRGYLAELDTVDRRLEGVPEQDAIAALIRERGESRSKLAELERALEQARGDLERTGRDLEVKERDLQRLQRRIADASWENEVSRRVVRASAEARANLAEFRTKVLERNLRRVESLILQSFQELLRKESLVASLAIDPEDMGIRLFGEAGRLIHPDRLSAGERQLLAVSILWGLARASHRVLPTIVDTPLGRLDSVHRAHLVSRYFPYASHQVILLSTDEEINEAHLDRIGDFIGRSYHLEYDDRTGATTPLPGYFQMGGVA
ncbi:DNA sulfur modification protein DndD [Gaopeijia maritima]|uniref:DNA sulfur modification protein DndD n=1 Tax=Gaopeijia maritima TaxID=3119007 RepID=UPI00328195CC